jgi:hypothetical protein
VLRVEVWFATASFFERAAAPGVIADLGFDAGAGGAPADRVAEFVTSAGLWIIPLVGPRPGTKTPCAAH